MAKSNVIISVLMPAYNAELYIKEAIESILNQSFENFELIIVDDGSTDNTLNIIDSFNDARIKLFKNEKNRGVIYTANYAMTKAKGEYIARMDSDDIAEKNRLEKQIDFFNRHPEISILGGAYKILGKNIVIPHPKYDNEIKIKMLKNMSICNPSMMIRAEIIKKYDLYYDENYPSAEDYNFFIDAALKGLKMANLEDVILNYRQHETQISHAKSDEQQTTSDNIRKKYYENVFGDTLLEKELDILKNLKIISSKRIKETFPLLMKVYYSNKKINFFDNKLLTSYICGIIYNNFESHRNFFMKDFMEIFRYKMPLRIRYFTFKYMLNYIWNNKY